MKYYRIILMSIILTLLYSCSRETTHTDKIKKYKITFPNSITKYIVVNPITLEKETEYKCVINSENSFFSTIAYNIPDDFYKNDPNRIERVIYSIVFKKEFSDNNLIQNKLIKYANFTGYDLKWELKNDIIAHKNVFLINNILYILSVKTPSDKNHNNIIFDFFKSFEIDGILNTKKIIKDTIEKSYVIKFNRKTKFDTQETYSDNYGHLIINAEMTDPIFNGDNFIYGIVSSRLPISSDSTDVKKQDEIFNEFIQGALNSLPANLLSKKDIKYNSFPGKEIEMQWYMNGKEVIIKTRYYFILNNFYGLMVYYEPKKENIIETKKFYNSFKPIIEKETPTNTM